jgi:predicted HTH domain antitoxin
MNFYFVSRIIQRYFKGEHAGGMHMKNIQLNIPLPDMSSTTELDLKVMLAAKLYETEQLSLGQAADVAGLSKRAFTELLGNYGVSLFSQNLQELREDIANA